MWGVEQGLAALRGSWQLLQRFSDVAWHSHTALSWHGYNMNAGMPVPTLLPLIHLQTGPQVCVQAAGQARCASRSAHEPGSPRGTRAATRSSSSRHSWWSRQRACRAATRVAAPASQACRCRQEQQQRCVSSGGAPARARAHPAAAAAAASCQCTRATAAWLSAGSRAAGCRFPLPSRSPAAPSCPGSGSDTCTWGALGPAGSGAASGGSGCAGSGSSS